jgi:hypothetical protein
LFVALQENQGKLFKEAIQFDAQKLQNGGGSGLGLWSKFYDIHVHVGDGLDAYVCSDVKPICV